MDGKFSVSDCLKFSITSVLDNFRLFFVANLALGCFMFMVLIAAGVANWGLVSEIRTQVMAVKCEAPVAQPAKSMAAKIVGTCKGKAYDLIMYVPIILKNGKMLALTLLLALFLFLGFMLGMAKFMLDFVDTGTARVATIYSEMFRSPKVFIAGFLYFVMVVVGLSAFIIPGIILMIRFGFFALVIADKNAGIIESLRRSFALTRGFSWQLLCIAIIVMALCTGSVIGFIGWPIAALIQACAYRRLPQMA